MKPQYLLLAAILCALLCSSARAQSVRGDLRDLENVYDYINGYFSAFGLPDPIDVYQCFNQQEAGTIMTFYPQILSLACNVTKENYDELRAVWQEMFLQLPATITLCLDATSSYKHLLVIMNAPIDWDLVTAYVVLHLQAVKSSVCVVKDSWDQGEYFQAGDQTGAILKKILNIDLPASNLLMPQNAAVQNVLHVNSVVPPTEAEQNFLNGFFTQFGLAKPQTIMTCIPPKSQQDIYDFAADFLEKSCSAKAGDVKEIVQSAIDFYDKMPYSMHECLLKNKEATAISKKIGTVSYTRVIAYITLHFRRVQKSVCEINCLWRDDEHEKAGKASADLLKEILDLDARQSDAEEFLLLDQIDTPAVSGAPAQVTDSPLFATTPSPAEAEQEFLNGFYTEFDLDRPKTILKCFPESEQKRVFEFVPTFLDKACRLTVKELRGLIDYVTEFMESLPETVTDCLSENKEVEALTDEIGPIDMREVLTYITLHFKALREDVCEIETVWRNEEFEDAGTKSAVIVKEITAYDEDSSSFFGDEDELERIIDQIQQKLTNGNNNSAMETYWRTVLEFIFSVGAQSDDDSDTNAINSNITGLFDEFDLTPYISDAPSE